MGRFYFKIKKCSKAHSYCRICRPDIYNRLSYDWLHTKETIAKVSHTIVKYGLLAGKNSPHWKGGLRGRSLVGWKGITREVRARDTHCRACGLLPEKNRRMDVHHIKSKRKGGVDTLENLVALHRSCHIKVEYGKMKIHAPQT